MDAAKSAHCTKGKRSRMAPMPIPARLITKVIHTATPRICGTVLRKPKFTPEAMIMMLFGPGVIVDAVTNATIGIHAAKSIPKPLFNTAPIVGPFRTRHNFFGGTNAIRYS